MRILDRLTLAAWGAVALPVQPQQAAQAVKTIQVHGGTRDDQAFARVALGAARGAPIDEAWLAQALAAVKATDRFRGAEGSLSAPDGCLDIRLDPWPKLRSWAWEGDPLAPREHRSLFPDLRKGIALGSRRLEAWRSAAERRLRMRGHPSATLQVRRTEQDAALVFRVLLGPPALIRAVHVQGDPRPYSREQILQWSGLEPGRTFWTLESRQQAISRIRRHFIKDQRYQGQVSATWKEADGGLELAVTPGPVVKLKVEGTGLGWTSLADLVPLARAERYSPELLDEGERRILRHLRGRGYLDAKVSHVQEILSGPPDRPDLVQVVYRLASGNRVKIAAVTFEKNLELPESRLVEAVALPHRWLLFGAPLGTPDLLSNLEERTKGLYLSKGFADIGLRRRIEPLGEQHALVFQVREGSQRLLKAVRLSLPAGQPWRDWAMGLPLLRVLSDAPRPEGSQDPSRRLFRSDRPGLDDVTGVLERVTPEGTSDGAGFLLTLSRPIPFVKGELALCLADLRQKAQGLGVRKPSERVRTEESDAGLEVRIDIPDQPLASFNRIVVAGADESRAEAVLREISPLLGAPFDPAQLSRMQAQLGNLGAFQRVDLVSLSEAGEPAPAGTWSDGDLMLGLEERPPWVLHSGFGYDKTLGYYLGFGVQRLNFQGMGRTLDLGFRAGDATLKAPALRKLFPTGDFARSVDNYSLGYSDPWFPTAWAPWLPERAQYRAEASYIQEQKTSYLIRRRRVVNDLEWRLSDQLGFQMGHRYERSESRYVDLIDFNDPLYDRFKPYAHIFENEGNLNTATRSPARAVVSAPYVQWYHDSRDSRIDPTQGAYTQVRVELANQLFGTSPNSSFVRMDARQQWIWPVGFRAQAGVVSLGLRVGAVYPTGSSDPTLPANERLNLPLSERYFAGGPGTHRGIEPDSLGPRTSIPRLMRNDEGLYQPVIAPSGQALIFDYIPMGGEGLALINLEYRFPLWGQSIWGEVFLDSGQVYSRVKDTQHLPGSPPFPPFVTALGAGVIFKIGLPIKVEYGADWRRILGRPRSREDRISQLKSLLISAGFTF